jgi:catechol 2,3-dioxygenase-like lactoylglutathione lyase family enzyme
MPATPNNPSAPGPLSGSRVVAFVPTTDTARARVFFANTLGLRVVREDAFALVLEANGTTVRVARVDAFSPAPFTVLGWTVDDIDGVVAGLRQAGVAVLRFDGMDQDDLGIWTAPGGGRVAWFKDPDGNVLSVTMGG